MIQNEEERNNILDLLEERRRLDIALQHVNWATRQVRDQQDAIRASNKPEPRVALRREADTTDENRINKMIENFRELFTEPPSPPNIVIKPMPISVATQTWETTNCQPKISLPPLSEEEKPVQIIAHYKPKRIQSKPLKGSKIKSLRPNTGVKKSAESKRLSYMMNYNKRKYEKTVQFSIPVSKSGRYDQATTKRSVSPVLNAKPSDPFK